MAVIQINSVSLANVRPDRATFEAYSGSVRVYPNGSTPTQRPNDYPTLRSTGTQRDQVWVAGDLRSWAHLRLWPGDGEPIVQAGTDGRSTRYTFPCRIQLGSGTIAWGLSPVGSSACEYITVDIGGNDPIALKASEHWELKNGETVTEAAATIARKEQLTLIATSSRDDELTVDVLVGSVEVTPTNGAAISIGAGNRYVQDIDGSRIESISDVNEIRDSSSMETFLDETQWSPDVKPLLDQLKSVLFGSAELTESQRQILDTHNQLRAEVGVAPLSWSAELATLAQDWADTLSRNNDFRHRPGISGSGAGENISGGSTVEVMLDQWTQENSDYDPISGQCRPGRVCGHYTQMVWRNTTEVGCGIALHGTYRQVLVCNYRPPGNYVGQRPY